MPLDDDDDDKWVYQDHTAAKHEVLSKYLTPWTNKLTSYNEKANRPNKIRVVDCFSGRGSYVSAENTEPYELEHLSTEVEIPGSPLIILDRLTDRSNEFHLAEVELIEYNPTNFDILEGNLDNTDGVADNIDVTPHQGKFENKVLDTIRSTDGRDCPTFFFIDPFGFQALDYNIITELGSTPQFEFLITFMSRDINRFFEVENHEEAIEKVFGRPDFREKVNGYNTENWEALVEYYTDRLEDEGPEYTFEYLITEPDTRQTVYYLVFGSNSGQGLKTMRDVMHHCGTGGFAYAPRHQEHTREQTGLGDWGGGGNSTKNFLLDHFEKRRIEFEMLLEECSEERKYADDIEKDYRSAIKELESSGKADVIRVTSKKGGSGVQEGDLIDFRDTQEELG